MSNFTHKPGQFSIFKNEKKSENAPDYKGKGVNLQGEEFDIALWIKEGQKGKFFSGKLSEPWTPADENQATQEMDAQDQIQVEQDSLEEDGLPF